MLVLYALFIILSRGFLKFFQKKLQMLSFHVIIRMEGCEIMQLGEMIKKMRIEKGLKQDELAEKTGISRVSLGFYERNQRQPTMESVGKIAAALGVSIYDLLNSGDTWEEKTGDLIRLYEEKYQVNLQKLTPEQRVGVDSCISKTLECILSLDEPELSSVIDNFSKVLQTYYLMITLYLQPQFSSEKFYKEYADLLERLNEFKNILSN